MGGIDLKEFARTELRRHPRVEFQKLCAESADRGRLVDALPAFVPFKGKTYAGCLWILDWDHRLPSKNMVVRLYAFYEAAGKQAGVNHWQRRADELKKQDLFPEFDVGDFAGLEADEAYEAEWEVGAPPPARYRLASQWRRDIAGPEGRAAEALVRDSKEFKTLQTAIKERPAGLGDLEAAEWAAPSESGHDRWGIEVWYLRNFNGMVGEGTAFLVDLEKSRIVSQREFQFRAG